MITCGTYNCTIFLSYSTCTQRQIGPSCLTTPLQSVNHTFEAHMRAMFRLAKLFVIASLPATATGKRLELSPFLNSRQLHEHRPPSSYHSRHFFSIRSSVPPLSIHAGPLPLPGCTCPSQFPNCGSDGWCSSSGGSVDAITSTCGAAYGAQCTQDYGGTNTHLILRFKAVRVTFESKFSRQYQMQH